MQFDGFADLAGSILGSGEIDMYATARRPHLVWRTRRRARVENGNGL